MTKAAEGLSAITGRGLESSMQMLLRGQVGNMRAFKMLGFEIDTTKSKQEQFNEVIKRSMAGLDQASRTTFTSVLNQIRNAAGEVLKVLGKGWFSKSEITEGFQYVLNGIRGIRHTIEDMFESGALKGFNLESMGKVIGDLILRFTAVILTLPEIGRQLKGIFGDPTKIVAVFTDMIVFLSRTLADSLVFSFGTVIPLIAKTVGHAIGEAMYSAIGGTKAEGAISMASYRASASSEQVQREKREAFVELHPELKEQKSPYQIPSMEGTNEQRRIKTMADLLLAEGFEAFRGAGGKFNAEDEKRTYSKWGAMKGMNVGESNEFVQEAARNRAKNAGFDDNIYKAELQADVTKAEAAFDAYKASIGQSWDALKKNANKDSDNAFASIGEKYTESYNTLVANAKAESWDGSDSDMLKRNQLDQIDVKGGQKAPKEIRSEISGLADFWSKMQMDQDKIPLDQLKEAQKTNTLLESISESVGMGYGSEFETVGGGN